MMFEYILIADVNDTDEQARELAKIARRLSAPKRRTFVRLRWGAQMTA
jgi:adenine C2-methylase RlmN of 23S rRNA A2503 and tRNA A37